MALKKSLKLNRYQYNKFRFLPLSKKKYNKFRIFPALFPRKTSLGKLKNGQTLHGRPESQANSLRETRNLRLFRYLLGRTPRSKIKQRYSRSSSTVTVEIASHILSLSRKIGTRERNLEQRGQNFWAIRHSRQGGKSQVS